MKNTIQKTYICIDLKSFYASVECVERNLDTLDACLVVADNTRTNKTICLAVSPALKAFGVPGRPRLFEVEQIVRRVNNERARKAPHGKLTGYSNSLKELLADSTLGIEYITAVPRMNYYMKYSADIYKTYMKYVAPEDVHVYSIDEVFINATPYLNTYGLNGHQLCIKMIRDVLSNTGITATGGVGSNMFLAKVAMDIIAKKMPADADGVRIAELDEYSFREQMWNHKPITDVWMIGKGIARRLENYGIYTLGDLAMYSLDHQDKLFKEFGVNAELLIDHSWGYEPTEMKTIKQYKAKRKSLSSGQVLMRPYNFAEGRIIATEMADALSLDMVSKKVTTKQVSIFINYDIENVEKGFEGNIVEDYYGRLAPKPAHGNCNLPMHTNATSFIVNGILTIYDKVVNPALTIRKITVIAQDLVEEADLKYEAVYEQSSLFDEPEDRTQEFSLKEIEKERKVQEVINQINKTYGKNSVFKGINKEKAATGLARNKQVGGHKG